MEALSDTGLWMTLIFIIGYTLITLEHFIHINKATIALMMAIILWIFQFKDQTVLCEESFLCLGNHLASVSQVIFFLLGALAVVEIINAHKGFRIISDLVQTRSKRKLLWVIGVIAFLLSSVLDNLTTTIVMITLLTKIVSQSEERLILGAGIVIAANAGGAWTPIGDVTTTMLWIGGQLSALQIIRDLILPSLACFVASFLCLHFMLKGNFEPIKKQEEPSEPLGNLIFFTGIGLLIFVPIFKMLTGLPPFMGMLFALSTLWIITDIAHYPYQDRQHLRVPHIFTKVDITSVLFFLGILIAVNALETAHVLSTLAQWFDKVIGNSTVIAVAIGLASAIIDNVPLVAASMSMYDLTQYPIDSHFWKLIAYCAGTGGSILIIGSAAGVVYMGLENVNFFWYLRRISLPALVGYLVGVGIYLLG